MPKENAASFFGVRPLSRTSTNPTVCVAPCTLSDPELPPAGVNYYVCRKSSHEVGIGRGVLRHEAHLAPDGSLARGTAYDAGAHLVYGATAIILTQFLGLARTALDGVKPAEVPG